MLFDQRTTLRLHLSTTRSSSAKPEQIDFEASMEFRDETTITCRGRRFSVLWTAQEGGAICILAGARAPFLLRNTNGAHILIADAYTDGIVSIKMHDFRFQNTDLAWSHACSAGASLRWDLVIDWTFI